jgi:pimeloyl-ACP methyl ester carboxylesterase
MSDIVHGSVSPDGFPTLAYSQTGSGRDVVLLHGALVTREDMMFALFSALADGVGGDGFRVTAFDRPGHGDSGRLGPTGSPWRQAEAIHAASLALGLQPAVVVGHSHGGAVAMAHALQFPEQTVGVVGVAPIAFPEVRLEHLLFAPRGMPMVGPMLNQAISAGLDPVLLPILWRAMFLPQAPPARYKALFPFGKAGSAAQTEAEGEDSALLNSGLLRSAMAYASCRTPVRIFGGDRDLVVNNALHGRLLAQILPDGQFETLPGLGHMAHHFAQAPIAEAVRRLAG